MLKSDWGAYGLCSHRVVKRGEKFFVARHDAFNRDGTGTLLIEMRNQNAKNNNSSSTNQFLTNLYKNDDDSTSIVFEQNATQTKKKSKAEKLLDLLVAETLTPDRRPNRISLFGVFPPAPPNSASKYFERRKMFPLDRLPDPDAPGFARGPKKLPKKSKDPFEEHCKEIRRYEEKFYPQWSYANKPGGEEIFEKKLSSLPKTIEKSENFFVNPKYSNVLGRDPFTNKLVVAPTFENLMQNVVSNLPQPKLFVEERKEVEEEFCLKFTTSPKSKRERREISFNFESAKGKRQCTEKIMENFASPKSQAQQKDEFTLNFSSPKSKESACEKQKNEFNFVFNFPESPSPQQKQPQVENLSESFSEFLTGKEEETLLKRAKKNEKEILQREKLPRDFGVLHKGIGFVKIGKEFREADLVFHPATPTSSVLKKDSSQNVIYKFDEEFQTPKAPPAPKITWKNPPPLKFLSEDWKDWKA